MFGPPLPSVCLGVIIVQGLHRGQNRVMCLEGGHNQDFFVLIRDRLRGGFESLRPGCFVLGRVFSRVQAAIGQLGNGR